MERQVVLHEAAETEFGEPVGPVGRFVDQERAGQQIADGVGDRLGGRPSRNRREQDGQRQRERHREGVRRVKRLESGSGHADGGFCS